MNRRFLPLLGLLMAVAAAAAAEPAPAPPAEFRVKPGKDRLGLAREKFEARRRKQGLPALLDDMLVVVCNEGAGAKAINRTDELMRNLQIDFVDWMPLGPLAKKHGVRTSGAGPEYQEYYPVENPGLDAKKLADGGGYAVSLDGKLLHYDEWIAGGMYVCHNGDAWHEWFKDELWRKGGAKAAICQDNISCVPWCKGGGCFCPACDRKFRDYLRERYPAADLAKLGVSDLATFSIHEALVGRSLTGQDAIDNPLVFEFVKFEHVAQAAAWADCAQAWKDKAAKQNRALPVYGNQIGIGGMWPFALLLSPFCDLVQIEEVTGGKSKVTRCGIDVKMARASANHERPVWIRGPIHGVKGGPECSPVYWTVHMAEALAAGGVRDFSVGYNVAGRTPQTKDYIDDAELMKCFADFAKFMRSNRPLFSRRESAARVAIVYSIPSSVFRRFYPLKIDRGDLLERHRGWAKQLDAWHVPYDVVLFGHPELWDDAAALARLPRYKALVFSNGDAMTAKQIQSLQDFQKKGGTIFSAGRLGTRDENYNPRPDAEVPDFGAASLLPDDKLDAAKDRLVEVSGVRCALPELTQVNLWRGQGGKSLDVHLVNFDVDLGDGKYNRVEPGEITVELPAGTDAASALAIRPYEKPVTVPLTKSGTQATFKPPALDGYMVVTLTVSSRYAGEQKAADGRREMDRKAVMVEATRLDLY